jgi:hypothetical protein
MLIEANWAFDRVSSMVSYLLLSCKLLSLHFISRRHQASNQEGNGQGSPGAGRRVEPQMGAGTRMAAQGAHGFSGVDPEIWL